MREKSIKVGMISLWQRRSGSSNGEAKRKRKSINITFRLLVYVSIYYRSPNAKYYRAINPPVPERIFSLKKKKLSLHGTVKRTANVFLRGTNSSERPFSCEHLFGEFTAKDTAARFLPALDVHPERSTTTKKSAPVMF